MLPKFYWLCTSCSGFVAKKTMKGFTEISRNLGVYDMPVNFFKWKHYAGEIMVPLQKSQNKHVKYE